MRPDTRAFLERVRDAENPSRADEERVLRALQASLAAGAAAGALGHSGFGQTWIAKTAAALGSFGSKLSLVAAFTAAALGGADSARSEQAPIERTVSSVARAPQLRPEPTPKVDEPRLSLLENRPEMPSKPAPEKPETAERPEKPAERRVQPLRAELALLREVQAALRQGDGATALRALDAHRSADRRLLAERQAARILALCQLGRVVEARSAALSFAKAHPSSVQRAAVENSCAGTPSAQRIVEP